MVDSSTTEEVATEAEAEETTAPEDKSGKTVPYDRFKQVNDELKKLKGGKDEILQDDGDTDVSKTVAELKSAEDRREFQDEHNLTKDQALWLWKYSNGKPTAEMLEDDGVKAALKAVQTKQSVDDNTPSGTKGVATFKGKTWNEIATDPDISDDEKNKAYRNLSTPK